LSRHSHLYFHAPCFDGVVSAVLMHEFLATEESGEAIDLHPVNYQLNELWAAMRLEEPATIVDFLYHPDATIWLDHHKTSFQSVVEKDQLLHNENFYQHYLRRRGPRIVFEPAMTSCARLIWESALTAGKVGNHREEVEAADRIDSARYLSPNEAVLGETPALRINASMAIGTNDELQEYATRLVIALLSHNLSEVAEFSEVAERFFRFKGLRDRGLERFRNPGAFDYARLEDDGIFVFNIDGSDVIINRYFPFLIAPNARYSLGLVRTGSEGTIRAMRNPWLEFPSVDLSLIFGSGHRRVASRRLHNITPERAESNLREMLGLIRQAISRQQEAGAFTS
jgi:hypothetical protein